MQMSKKELAFLGAGNDAISIENVRRRLFLDENAHLSECPLYGVETVNIDRELFTHKLKLIVRNQNCLLVTRQNDNHSPGPGR